MEQQTFDIENGVSVYGEDGDFVGTVTEIAGFGSTRIDHLSDPSAGRVTEAQSGTDYLRVEHAGRQTLHVPFHGIQSVLPGRGVTLTAATIDQLRTRAGASTSSMDAAVQTGQRVETAPRHRRWNLALPHRWRVWQLSTWSRPSSEVNAATGTMDTKQETR